MICTYLDRDASRAIRSIRGQTRDFVQALWLEEYADGTIFREVVHGLFFQKIIRPNILQAGDGQRGDDRDPERRAAEGVRLPRADDQRRIPGSRPTSASPTLRLVSNLINFHYLGYRIDAHRFPKLAAYFAKRVRHPSIETALRAERPVATNMGLDQSFMRELTTS